MEERTPSKPPGHYGSSVCLGPRQFASENPEFRTQEEEDTTVVMKGHRGQDGKRMRIDAGEVKKEEGLT